MKFKSAIGYAWERIEQPMHTLTIKALAICLGMSVVFGSNALPVKELMVQEVYAATQEITEFTDYGSIRDYAKEPISVLLANGGIQGYPDGSFKPSNSISRIEFLSMAFNAVDPSGSARAKIINDMKNEVEIDKTIYNIFKDSLADDIADVWGGKAQDLLILSAEIGTGRFDSEDEKVNGRSAWLAPVTRAESAQMLAVALEKLGGEQLTIKDNVESIIGDWDESHSDKALSANPVYDEVAGCVQRPYIQKLYSAGIVTGNENGDFQPQYNLKRCDAAVLVYKAINKNKRATVNIAAKPEAPKPANTTLNVNDANRRDAIAGDKFVAADGKTYDVVAGKGGVLGEGQPIALDLNRIWTNAVNGQVTVIKNGAGSNGTVGRLGDTYYINPDTGEGHWGDDWQKIEQAYAATQPKGKVGDVVHVGLGGWLKMECAEDGAWVTSNPDWM